MHFDKQAHINASRGRLSIRLCKAIVVLREKYSEPQIREIASTSLSFRLSNDLFSKMQGAHSNEEYRKSVAEPRYSEVLTILDERILEEFGLVWDGEDYGKIEATINDPRIDALIGRWQCYSWDYKASNNPEKIEYIHHFKVDIISRNKIICNTQKGAFIGTNIISISDNRVAVEISEIRRKVFFVIDIGNGSFESLLKETIFYVVYADSARDIPKAGVAIFQRSQEEYSNLIVGSKDVSSMEQKDFVRQLRGKQVMAVRE
ncbi:hypothetical protein [Ferruginibacter sp.]